MRCLSRILRCLSFVGLVIPVILFAGEQKLILLHTNDIHASFVPHEATWIKSTPKPMVGGFVRLEEAIDSVRSLGIPSILLDAGDVMTGNPISEIVYRGAYGGALFEMMNRTGYDVWEPGNHDLDISQDNLRALASIAAFPTVCANLVDQKGEYPLHNKPYVIITRGGIRVGIIGLMSQELYGLVNQQNLTGLRVLSPSETAQRWIDELRPKADLVVLLTHEGVEEDSALAEAIHGADIIVGGHSHTRIRIPRVVNGIRIVQTGSNCENLGVVEVTFRDDKPVKYWGNLVQLWARANPKPESVTSLVDSMRQVIDKQYDEVVGRLPEDWSSQGARSPLALFVTEAQRTAASAQISFMNSHGVRKDLLAGPITRRDIFEVLPFRNVLVTFQLSGAQVKSVLRYYLEKHPAIVMTGVSARWSSDAGGEILLEDVRVGDTPIEEGSSYVCVASDFFVGEAEKYIGMPIDHAITSSTTLYSAVEQAIRREGTLRRVGEMKLERSHP